MRPITSGSITLICVCTPAMARLTSPLRPASAARRRSWSTAHGPGDLGHERERAPASRIRHQGDDPLSAVRRPRKGQAEPRRRNSGVAHAAAQAPSKLGLRPGSSIRVEDAIKVIVTKSANDIAVAVAERDRRLRKRIRGHDDAKGPCARHDPYGLPQRLGPAQMTSRSPRPRIWPCSGARSGPISRDISAISPCANSPIRQAPPYPRPSDGSRAGHRQHQDRLHQGFRLQPAASVKHNGHYIVSAVVMGGGRAR